MPEYDPKVRRRVYRAELGAYLLIVTLAVVGFWRQEQTQEDLCGAVADNREIATELVNSVSQLGTALVSNDRPPEQLTPEQRAALERIESFRNDRLEKLSSSQPCND